MTCPHCHEILPESRITFWGHGQRECEMCWWAAVERATGYASPRMAALQLEMPEVTT